MATMKTPSDPAQERITVRCRNGHKLKAPPKLIGQSRPCPVCKVTVVIEDPNQSPQQGMSDLDILDMLGPSEKLPEPPSAKEAIPERTCTNCGATIAALRTVCASCNCYVGSTMDVL